jgi:serine/threonine protein kinase
VHGALHPANVMVGGDTEKFNDLKVEMTHQEGDTKSCFVAPEVAGGKNYTQKSDMWAVGVIAYLVLTWQLD